MPQIHSEEIQDLLGAPPMWITRYGISILGVLLLATFSVAWIVQYPDVVKAPIVLTATNAPIRMAGKTNGRLARLTVADGAAVAQGELLAALQSSANIDDVLHLEQDLQRFANNDFSAAYANKNIGQQPRQIGELQAAYSEFTAALDGLLFFKNNNLSPAQIANIKTQIAHYADLATALRKQISTLHEEVALAKRNYDRNRNLLPEGVVSSLDVEQKQTVYLQYQRQEEQLSAQIINYDISTAQLEAQIFTADHAAADASSSRTIALREAVRKLQAAVLAWKETYLLYAVTSGAVSFSAPLSIGQPIEAGKPLFTLVPAMQAVVGRVRLPPARSGKVREGQLVHIKLDNYPFREYGALSGTVSKISLVVVDSNYLLQVQLLDDLHTTRQQTLPFKNDMRGTAEIVTRPRRLLERLWDRLRV